MLNLCYYSSYVILVCCDFFFVEPDVVNLAIYKEKV